ncbi:hypothetical protein [Croceimicrobium hydrocarbonivorans]|uniref:Uncharacterized protein n=1 Tax=Croceimicrobium hydrocarbonivorans TaxID=2761580 RepID=A0A7H0VIE2_9FLAO|nr:hypothetical protein [Croceimicrobium hydrocarbonivorans]QNR25490.1 hypothetical protein H4K34_06520 [Croceimicrobium hydrocarbonivorans]
MINQLKSLDIHTLPQLLKFVTEHRDLSFWKTGNRLGSMKASNGFGTVYYDSGNALFSVIGINSTNEIIDRFFLSGNFDLTYTDLVDLFGKPREAYSSYDDEYQNFFNEENDSPWVVSCRTEKSIISQAGILIHNLQFSWKQKEE